jgi:cyclopropane-fatty-acyl-phospholipid synthase
MTNDTPKPAAAMQGGGFYNRHSSHQAANLTSALPLLEQAARTVSLEGPGSLVIADYGSSQGRNSMRPMSAAIEALRARAGSDRPIEVIHTDLPSNDFASLFTMLNDDPSSYLAGHPGVFPSAVGRSYFDPILPPGSVHLGWSSNALHWLSRNPVEAADHIWAIFSASAEAREAVQKLLAEDWRRFLLARASELRTGARLVCHFLCHGPDSHGFEWMSNELWEAVLDLGRDGLLSSEEQLHMSVPAAGRSVQEIEAPFAQGTFAGLALAHLSVVRAPDPFWDRYCETGDVQQLARSWADMMRAANGPSLAVGLGADREGVVFDELFKRLAARVAASPRRSESYNVMLVLEKVGSA